MQSQANSLQSIEYFALLLRCQRQLTQRTYDYAQYTKISNTAFYCQQVKNNQLVSSLVLCVIQDKEQTTPLQRHSRIHKHSVQSSTTDRYAVSHYKAVMVILGKPSNARGTSLQACWSVPQTIRPQETLHADPKGTAASYNIQNSEGTQVLIKVAYPSCLQSYHCQ